MQSADPTDALQNYDDYGILPRNARPGYPAFELLHLASEAQLRAYWTRYTNMCLYVEKNAIAAWARVLFLRAYAISEEEFFYNENLGLVDHKFRVFRSPHRIGPQLADWYDVIPDYDPDEVCKEMEPDLRDGSRFLGRPVRRHWNISMSPNVFKENTESYENALDEYWDYHDCGLIPKGTMKYIPFPERGLPGRAGDLVDEPMDFDDEQFLSHMTEGQERQWQSKLRSAEQLYLYEWAKALRAVEFDLTINEFEQHLSTGAIDAAWSGFINTRRRNLRSTAPVLRPTTAAQSPVQR
ncbi:hypothetical protein DOTSEDRAFT_72106 [Dothistroma septosporum NZE10]|uniref:Uncharacterized protein n=1 Tax=Dothistroma septosporum (strain NZE10 / CBS 128990) TaxID=675120 RepID=N1PQ71_DOTSN|nr:hypothetical protein DOTSEDRAFT_72106 [Dothistroma septosporum NZE10]